MNSLSRKPGSAAAVSVKIFVWQGFSLVSTIGINEGIYALKINGILHKTRCLVGIIA